MKILIHNESFTSKPSAKDVKTISNQITESGCLYNVTPSGLHSYLIKGHTVSPATYIASRKNDNFESQQFFFIDFDTGISPSGIYDRCYDFNIVPNFGYYTFSHSEEVPKFRIVFAASGVITNKEDRDLLQNRLMTLFPECDPQCKDASRLYFGGTRSDFPVYYDTFINEQYLEQLAPTQVKARYGKHSSRHIPKVVKSGEKTGSPIILYKGHHTIEPIEHIPESRLCETCKLYSDLCDDVKLHHHEAFGLATNVIHIKGGGKWIKSRLDAGVNKVNGDGNDKNWPAQINYIQRHEYGPMKCSDFCPYHESCNHGINLLATLRLPRGCIEMKKEITRIPVEEAYQNMVLRYQSIINENDKKVHIIKCPTGLGKTEMYTSTDGITVAVPTHELKSEVQGRFQAKGLNADVTPKMPQDIPDNIKSNIKRLYDLGAHSKARAYMKRVCKSGGAEVESLRRYMSDAVVQRQGLYVTTHERILHRGDNNDILVIDEDILQTMFNIDRVKVDELFRMIFNCSQKNRDKFRGLVKLIQEVQLQPGIMQSTPKVCGLDFDNIIDSVIKDRNISTSVLGFLNSDIFVVDPNNNQYIHFIKKRELPKDKTIIILSATINETISKLVFGDDVDFYDVGFVEETGKVLQNAKRSCSRHQLKNSYLNEIQTTVQGEKVITFKGLEDEFNTVGTFGAIQGLDHLKGEDLCVVGTPHISENAYFLWCCALGVHKNLADFNIEYSVTENEHYRFKFNSYHDENLKAIQFYLVESELVQAVGRARVVRCDCTVTVYSNYPVPGAEFNH